LSHAHALQTLFRQKQARHATVHLKKDALIDKLNETKKKVQEIGIEAAIF
jgi:hypothetical protein